MNKRGQITLFVIIAILIVGAVIGIVYSQNIANAFKEITTPEAASAFHEDLDRCAEESATSALPIISLQGGYIAPNNYFSDKNLHIAYWYNKGFDISPDIERVSFELSSYTCVLMDKCIDTSKYSFNITKGICTAKALVKDDYTILTITYPISAVIGEKTYSFEKFTPKVSARLGKAFKNAKSIVSEQTKHPDTVCLTCLADLGEASNVKIEVGSQNDTQVISIIDQLSEINNQPYTFKFAIKI